MSKYGVISGPYFTVFGLNAGKYRPEINPKFSCSAGLSRYYSSITLLTECYKLGCHLLDFILGRNIKAELNKRSKRTRIVFSSEEEDFIIQSVRKFGVGQWAKILQNFDFYPSRASASIKDKYRTMKRQGIF